MSGFTTPILFLVFNRPAETKKVFEVIKKIAPTNFYIAADGPRKNNIEDLQLCKSVKKIVSEINWDCNLKRLFRTQNLGCREAVSQAIYWFFENEEQGIILEDDCLPDLSFFPYCSQLLERYKDDNSIISIGGTNLGYQFPNHNSYGFSRFMNMWGWATWRRSSVLIDYEMKTWEKMLWKKFFLHKKLHHGFLDLDYNWINFWFYYFNETASRRIDTWDYQWIFTQLYYNKISIFPSTNLIKNIGFSDTATHTLNSSHPVSNLFFKPITFPLKEPANKAINIRYETDLIKKKWFIYRKESLYRIFRSNFLNTPIVFKTLSSFRKRTGELK